MGRTLFLLCVRQGRCHDSRNHQECDKSQYAVVGAAEHICQPAHQKWTEKAAQVVQCVDRAASRAGHRGGEEQRRDCPEHGSRGLQEGTRQDQAGERQPDFIFENDGKQQAESEVQQGNNDEALKIKYTSRIWMMSFATMEVHSILNMCCRMNFSDMSNNVNAFRN